MKEMCKLVNEILDWQENKDLYKRGVIKEPPMSTNSFIEALDKEFKVNSK